MSALVLYAFSVSREGLARIDELAAKYPGLLRTLPAKPECYEPTYFDRQDLKEEVESSTQQLKDKLEQAKRNLPTFIDNEMLGLVNNLRVAFSNSNKMFGESEE